MPRTNSYSMLCIGCDTTACWKVSSITFPDHASCDRTLLRWKRKNRIGRDGNVPFETLLAAHRSVQSPVSVSFLFSSSLFFFSSPSFLFSRLLFFSLSPSSRFPSFLCPWRNYSRDQHEGNGPCFVISFHH